MLQQAINQRTYKRLRNATKLTKLEAKVVEKVIYPPEFNQMTRTLTDVEQTYYNSALDKFKDTARSLGIGYKGVYIN